MGNPFVSPVRLDGVRPDPTAGRGFVDDENPTRLTRRVQVVMRMIKKRLDSTQAFADDNAGFDQVVLTQGEQFELTQQMSTEDWQRLAAIHGAEAVQNARQRVLREAVQRG